MSLDLDGDVNLVLPKIPPYPVVGISKPRPRRLDDTVPDHQVYVLRLARSFFKLQISPGCEPFFIPLCAALHHTGCAPAIWFVWIAQQCARHGTRLSVLDIVHVNHDILRSCATMPLCGGEFVLVPEAHALVAAWRSMYGAVLRDPSKLTHNVNIYQMEELHLMPEIRKSELALQTQWDAALCAGDWLW